MVARGTGLVGGGVCGGGVTSSLLFDNGGIIMTREKSLVDQLEASNRIIALLVECYMTGRKLTRVEALQCQVCVDDNKAMISHQGVPA